MILLIDIGGTDIKYGFYHHESKNYEFKEPIKTLAQNPKFNLMERLYDIIDPIHEEIQGIAISTAGIVDTVTGNILQANQNLPNYTGTPVKKLLEEKYQVNVSIENDVNSALLGELQSKEYSNIHSALMFTIGTGIGGALFINNEVYHGFNHAAGEVGYSIINEENIEEVLSTTALVKRVSNQLNKTDIDGKWLFEQAIQYNNKVCRQEIEKFLDELVIFIQNSISLLNPEYVILGGGIMEQQEYLQPILRNKFNESSTNPLIKNNTKIRFARLGNKAGMIGAYVNYCKQRKL